jgi:predicted PurR-regulated permease PerM
VAKKPSMGFGTLNTILNTAPLIIQGATKLIKIIKDREDNDHSDDDIPATLDGLNEEINQINSRLDANDKSNIEQIKLIEELAKQNKSLASSLKKTVTQLNIISSLAVISVLISLFLVIRFIIK